MGFPNVTMAAWRAQVDKELGGVPFDQALVRRTLDGLAIQPLYVERPTGVDVPVRDDGPCLVCVHAEGEQIADEASGGAEALWIGAADIALARRLAPGRLLVIERADPAAIKADAADRILLACDPLASGSDGLAVLAAAAAKRSPRHPRGRSLLISTLPHHRAGANAVDEIALALSTTVASLQALLDAGLNAAAAAGQLWLQVSVGRDTFAELCKLRALRVCWRKLASAAGAPDALPLVHAVCSSRTLTARDPWVNMLRATTQLFAAILGGADLVTPTAYDEALGPASALGRRVARNAALVLREESALGRVIDPAGGAYYFETLTDQLARDGWRRFQALEARGGIFVARRTGALQAALEASWGHRQMAIREGREPILGVTDFMTPGETTPSTDVLQILGRRDAEDFER